ncbi:MAG: ribose-phosphate diphosphokinase, partial [Phycisphaerae bacterium]
IPLDHLTARPVLAQHFLELNVPDVVVVSPDVGHLKTANAYATRLNADLAVVDKRRISGDTAAALNIIGEVKDRNVLIFDDMIATAGTLVEAANLVHKHGAKSLYFGATHPVLAGPAFDRLEKIELNQFCVTDTIPLPAQAAQRIDNVVVLSVGKLMGEAILRIHEHRSISALFKE